MTQKIDFCQQLWDHFCFQTCCFLLRVEQMSCWNSSGMLGGTVPVVKVSLLFLTSTAFNFHKFTKYGCQLLTNIIPLIMFLWSLNQTLICATLDKSPPFHLRQVSPLWRKQMFCALKQLTWAAYKSLSYVAPRKELPTVFSWHHVPAYWCIVGRVFIL